MPGTRFSFFIPKRLGHIGNMHFRIICDFDGTIACDDVTDVLLERFAAPEWRAVEEEWKAGRIGSRECMLRQVDLLRAPIEEIDRCLDGIAVDPGFPGFVALARQYGAELMVVSDGLDYAIRRILGRFELMDLPIYANRLQLLGRDRYRLSFPHASDGCAKRSGTCKCRIATDGMVGAVRVLIGDGASDFCAATSVHLAFAKDKLLSYCRTNRLPHVAFNDFTDAARLLKALVATDAARLPFHLGAIAE